VPRETEKKGSTTGRAPPQKKAAKPWQGNATPTKATPAPPPTPAQLWCGVKDLIKATGPRGFSTRRPLKKKRPGFGKGERIGPVSSISKS